LGPPALAGTGPLLTLVGAAVGGARAAPPRASQL